MTDLNENWIEQKVGKGKRYDDLDDLLAELQVLRIMHGPNVGVVGGPIDLEIKIVEEMIEKESESDVHGESM
ncbi:MAG: hypothetical protein HXS54_05970 [Theionarchaea archaeon]|nr:hypothetical protein [Theionarchaea archaeon]DBA34805.1 TPA_asm: hypothetical protein vir521_00011 [Caudoviricetes sp. vir521]